jgi:phage gpG-like protein
MITFTVKTDFLKKALETKGLHILKAMKRGMQLGMYKFEAEIERTQLVGRPGLKRGSGNLAKSFIVETQEYGKFDFLVRLASRSKYAAIHQFGGRIVPRNARALTIPVHHDAKNHFARDFGDNLIFLPPRNGKPPMLARHKFGGGKKLRSVGLEIMYVLLKSVYIPKRLRILEAYKRVGPAMIGDEIFKQMRIALQK